jgi:hypothetical protein
LKAPNKNIKIIILTYSHRGGGGGFLIIKRKPQTENSEEVNGISSGAIPIMLSIYNLKQNAHA